MQRTRECETAGRIAENETGRSRLDDFQQHVRQVCVLEGETGRLKLLLSSADVHKSEPDVFRIPKLHWRMRQML